MCILFAKVIQRSQEIIDREKDEKKEVRAVGSGGL